MLAEVKLRLGIVALLALLASCGSWSPHPSAGASTTKSSAARASTTMSSAARATSTASTTARATPTAPTPAPSAGPASAGCGPPHDPTLASTGTDRIYAALGVAYGCVVPGGRSFRLGTVALFHRSRIEGVALGGRLAAYGFASMGVDTLSVQMIVRRLTDGAELASFPATNAVLPESFQSIGSAVVKDDGSVAWIGVDIGIGLARHTTQVLEARPSDSKATLLDSGVGIDPSSLRLQAWTLSWRHGSSIRHATLG
jgi:hypothetical protein